MLTQFVFYTALNRRKDAMRKRLKARKHSHSHPHQHHGSGGASSGAVTTTGSSSGAMHRQGSAHGPGGSSSSQHRGSGMGMSGSDYHSGAEGSASGSMMGSSGAAAASGAGVAGTAAAVGVSTAPGTLLIAAVACVSLLSLGVLGLGSAWDGGLHGAPMQDPSRSLHVAGAAAAAPHASAHAAVSSAMHAHAHGEQPDMQLAAGSPPGSIGAVMRHSSGRGHQAGSGAEPEPGGAAGSLQQLGWPWDQPGVNIEQVGRLVIGSQGIWAGEEEPGHHWDGGRAQGTVRTNTPPGHLPSHLSTPCPASAALLATAAAGQRVWLLFHRAVSDVTVLTDLQELVTQVG